MIVKPIPGGHVGISEGHAVDTAVIRVEADLGEVENVAFQSRKINRKTGRVGKS